MGLQGYPSPYASRNKNSTETAGHDVLKYWGMHATPTPTMWIDGANVATG
jgi:hypothetical protein